MKESESCCEEYKDMINEDYSKNYVDTSKSKTAIINYIKKNDSWFVSSLKIAQKLITEIDGIDKDFTKIKRPGWQNLYYQHGDEEIMQTMELQLLDTELRLLFIMENLLMFKILLNHAIDLEWSFLLFLLRYMLIKKEKL